MGLIMPLFPAFYSKVTALLGCVQGDKALCNSSADRGMTARTTERISKSSND